MYSLLLIFGKLDGGCGDGGKIGTRRRKRKKRAILLIPCLEPFQEKIKIRNQTNSRRISG